MNTDTLVDVVVVVCTFKETEPANQQPPCH